jgi:hypothetical protein
MHLSRYANPSQWTDLSPFKLVLASTSNKLYDNGQQQVAIRVEVQGKNGSQLVEISDDELDSIRLVTARTHQPLRHVGWEGVKVGDKEKWGVNEDYNGFVYHPDSAQDSTPVPRLRERVFYVQTRDINPLDIAAELTDDYLIPHYSDQDGGSEDNETIFKAMPRPSPIFAATNFKFEPLRVEGGSDNDNFLETVDYYELRLVVNEQIVRLVDFEFEGRDSMLRWESKQTDEDVFSYTGYYKPPTPPNNGAEPGPGTLAIDMAMEQRMPFPAPTLINGYVPPPGVIMISLHRGTSWNYDYVNGPQYERPLVLSVTDHFGNKHRLHIDFKALDNRNELVHRVIS